MPVIGYLSSGSPETDTPRLTGLRRGLSQTGYHSVSRVESEKPHPLNGAHRSKMVARPRMMFWVCSCILGTGRADGP